MKTTTSPRGQLRAEIARAAVAELLRGDLVDAGAEPARALHAAVGRAGVDDDDLDLFLHLLARDRLQAADEVEASVLDRDDDRDHVRTGVAATTNWYARSEGRRRPMACAARSTLGAPMPGTGTVKSSSRIR